MKSIMSAHVYEESPQISTVPDAQSHEARIRGAYSGICGSWFWDDQGKISHRRAPSCMGTVNLFVEYRRCLRFTRGKQPWSPIHNLLEYGTVSYDKPFYGSPMPQILQIPWERLQ